MPAIVSGWASTPNVDRVNYKVLPNALLGASLPIKHLKAMYRHADHEIKDPIGSISKLEYRKHNPTRTSGPQEWLWCEMTVTNKRVIDAIKRKVVTGFSVNFNSLKEEKRLGTIEVKTAAIVEISLVCEPANPECQIVSVREYEDHFEPVQKAMTKQFDCLIEMMKSVQRTTAEISKAVKT